MGHGKFGVVYRAESKADPTQIVAIKVLRHKSYLDQKAISDEIKILKYLDHPNIVKYYDEIEDGEYIFVVTEFCSGGELFDRISHKECFSESEAASITEKLLCALNYCHSKNIAHRDIKPENIMYKSSEEHAEVKLIDFGLAKKSDKYLKTYQTMVGTPFYIAPEVIDGNYTSACDVWSLGVVLHMMLSGYMPFCGATTEDIFRSIKAGKLDFDGKVWEKVSPPAKDLLHKLLEPDENQRVTASEALSHTWFKDVKTYTPDIDILDSGIMQSMKKYRGTSKFQQLCMNILVKTLKDEDINKLIEVFHNLDKERNGYIDTADLLAAFRTRYPAADIAALVKQLDIEGRGAINYSQFIAATMDAKKFLTTERLWALFQYFDMENNGYLTVDEIKEVLNQSGHRSYSVKDVLAMLGEHKIVEGDHIMFPKFAEIMSKLKFVPDEESIQKVVV